MRQRCRHSAGIQSAAEQYSDRYIANAAQSHCVIKRFSIPTNRITWHIFPPGPRPFGKVPPTPIMDPPVAPDEIVSRQQTSHTLERGTFSSYVAETKKLVPRSMVKPSRYTGSKQRFLFGTEVQLATI